MIMKELKFMFKESETTRKRWLLNLHLHSSNFSSRCRSDDRCCRTAIERRRTVDFKVALAYFIFMFSAAADSSKNCSLLIQ
ncbi:hypothetical protein P8452_11062 [Trifolium repens]|nr:hypothetical protein P8452_11062 [Trifolium repens]